MLNFLDALRPEQGLVESSELAPEAPPTDLLWRMLIRLNVDESRVRQTVPEGDGKLSPFVVGAYGYSRADSLVRGVGEAVERFSLINAAAPRQTAQDASSGNGAATHPHEWSWLVDPAFREDDSAHVVGLRLHSGDTCEVPLGLIDYPYVGPQADCFDESPSGAASGENADAAIRRALLEVIERDAFMVTWDCGIEVYDVSVEQIVAADAEDRRRATSLRSALEKLLGNCCDLGLIVRWGSLPVGIPDVVCLVAGVIDPSREPALATVGCKAHDSLLVAALGSLQEALQLRSVAYNLFSDVWHDRPTPDVVTSENDRMLRIISREGVEEISSWIEGFSTGRPTPTTRPLQVQDLVDGLVADGCHPVLVDLTWRLPPSLQAQGWAAVKVIPLDYQALRVDERLYWSRNHRRREQVVERTRLEGRRISRPEGGAPPHPLP